MPNEFAVAMEGLKQVIDWAKSAVNWKHAHDAEKREQVKTALTSLVNAASETRQYLAAIRRDPLSRNFTKEAAISQAWSKTGVDILPIDAALATRYLLKADYWSDPEGWTQAQKDERIIQLDQVYRLGQEALLGKP